MSEGTRILVVEDEAIVALDIRQRLEKMGYVVVATAATGEAALTCVRSSPPDLVLMDIQIKGDFDGIETARRTREFLDIPIVFLTANSDRATINRAKATGPLAYLLKPFEDRELQTTIEIAMERHRLERELKKSEKWLSVTLASIGDAIIAFDTSGRVSYLNPMAEQLTGWWADEARGRPAREILQLTLNESMEFKPIEPITEVLKSGATVHLPEYALLTRKDGVQLAVEDSAAPIRLEGGELVGAVVVFRDVTARILTEKKLREAERRVQNLVDTIHEGIGEVDEQEIIRFCNPAFARILGEESPEAVLGRSIIDFVDATSAERIAAESAIRRDGISSCYELTIVRRSHERRIVEITGTPLFDDQGIFLGTVGAIVDVTERKQLERELQQHRNNLEELVHARTEELRRASERLQQEFVERVRAEGERSELAARLQKAQKMEALGLLAGGVAHDLNNTLGPLVGYPELMMSKLPEDSPLRRMVEKIGRAAEDAAGVIQDLLTLARRGRYEMRPTNLNTIVSEFLESPAYLRLAGEKPQVRLEVELEPNLPNLIGSSPHLSKVVMNLVVNAFDAISDDGIIRIQTQSRQLNQLESGFSSIPSGVFVVLRIQDSGCGIAKEDLAKIFEPYFSKKRMGRSGTGLGLSVVYGIVEDHSGYYDVFSEVGHGTEFLFYFPSTTDVVDEQEPDAILGGAEKLLVVDDNEEQRQLAEEILGGLGYQVTAAVNGRAAIEYLRSNTCDLVILDMIMEPDFDGLDTYRAIKEFRPSQKAIVISGFSPTERVEKLLKLGASGYLKKPYSIAGIARLVRTALDSTGDGSIAQHEGFAAVASST